MRILFDHQVFSWQIHGGISRYFVEIARGLKPLGHEVFFPDDFYSINAYLPSLPQVRTRALSPFSFKGKKWLQNWLGRRPSLSAIRHGRPDVLHPTYFDSYFLPEIQRRQLPFVLTIHDMIHEKYGHGSAGLFSLDAHVVENKRKLALQANAIIAVSSYTKNDILQYIPGVNPDKIVVIHHGNSIVKSSATVQPSGALPEKYILFVGQRGAYKNFAWMAEQLADLLRSDPELQLVCAGGGSFQPEEQALLQRLKIDSQTRHLANLTDAALGQAYSKAACFIFPSQYEGFGIPILEAFAFGCPVVLNNTSCLPEIGGDAALYFSENEPLTLVSAVRKMLNDSSLRAEMAEKGARRLDMFSWEKSAALHSALYQNVVDGKL